MLVVLVAVTPVLASRVAQEETAVTFAPGDTVKIGLATDLSNVIPAPGQDIANAAQLAVDEFNEAGGLQGFTVELVVEDDRCVGEDATSVANLFVSDPQIMAVVGHVCSGASIPASEVYQEARIPMVSPSSTAGAFTARGLDVVNRVAFNDNIQGVVAARFIFNELGAERIAVLHDNSSYGEGLASTVSETFEELGGEVITFEVVDPEEQDFRPVLTVLAGEEPDLIYLGGYEAQAALIVQQMAEVGLEDTIFFSDDGVYTATYLELAGEGSEGTYVTFGAQVGDPDAMEAFAERYEEKFGVAPSDLGPFHGQAYDSASVLLNALNTVATLDDAGNLVIDREALIAAVRSTADYEGLSGLITCDENGDCGSATIAVFTAEGGEWVEVEVPEELQVSSSEE
ncbi:MAG: branched-chain amino acid ABC transporter substrate-binding protein, partial [Anaerolineae bacterium]|nr:branched-chain amino acid ABC transporter substrate-binding protein [Anaerolineae bacterium]